MFKKRKITNSQRPTRLTEHKNDLDAASEASTHNSSPVVKKSTTSTASKVKSNPVEDTPTSLESKRGSNISDGDIVTPVDGDDEEKMDAIGVFNGKLDVSKFTNTTGEEKKPSKFGPLKASAHIRLTTMTDYAPDVCKDYKQTGFCGYGDSCKFLHIREDYAAGWKIDKEWEIKQAGLAAATETDPEAVASKEAEEGKESEDQVPSECPICSKTYKSPVFTTCNHFFCESCYLSEFRKSATCFVCKAKTSGTVKPAGKLFKEKLGV